MPKKTLAGLTQVNELIILQIISCVNSPKTTGKSHPKRHKTAIFACGAGGLNHHQILFLALVRGFGFWYQPALDKRFLLAHDTPSIAHPFVAGWVFAFLVLLSCAGARCAASSLSLSSRA